MLCAWIFVSSLTFHLFVLRCSLSGKQVHQVPTELTNGVQNIVALHDSGQVNPKERCSS